MRTFEGGIQQNSSREAAVSGGYVSAGALGTAGVLTPDFNAHRVGFSQNPSNVVFARIRQIRIAVGVKNVGPDSDSQRGSGKHV